MKKPGELRARRIILAAAWLGLIIIAAVTLSPIGLRPQAGSPHGERLFAFTIVGALFGLAYPRSLWLVASLVVAVALGLEALQQIVPGRHGRIFDAAVKAGGALAGVAGAALLSCVRRRF